MVGQVDNVMTEGVWQHIAWSAKMDTGRFTCYVDGVDVSASASFSSFGNNNLGVGSAVEVGNAGVDSVDGCITQVYFDKSFTDFDVPSNLAKVYNIGSGVGVDFAASDITGSLPMVFLNGPDLTLNDGTIGNFDTVFGSVGACADGPPLLPGLTPTPTVTPTITPTPSTSA